YLPCYRSNVLIRYDTRSEARVSIGSGEPPFELLPAIDLRAGRVVRLLGGGFVAAGAGWIHTVDLDGARGGGQAQGDLIRRVLAAVGEGAACEVAGGLRDRPSVASS